MRGTDIGYRQNLGQILSDEKDDEHDGQITFVSSPDRKRPKRQGQVTTNTSGKIHEIKMTSGAPIILGGSSVQQRRKEGVQDRRSDKMATDNGMMGEIFVPEMDKELDVENSLNPADYNKDQHRLHNGIIQNIMTDSGAFKESSIRQIGSLAPQQLNMQDHILGDPYSPRMVQDNQIGFRPRSPLSSEAENMELA